MAPAAPDAGIVDEHVDARRPMEHVANATIHRRGIVDVQPVGIDGKALDLDRARQFGGRGGTAHAGVHFVAEAGEVQGGGESDAAATAGDQDDGHDQPPQAFWFRKPFRSFAP